MALTEQIAIVISEGNSSEFCIRVYPDYETCHRSTIQTICPTVKPHFTKIHKTLSNKEKTPVKQVDDKSSISKQRSADISMEVFYKEVSTSSTKKRMIKIVITSKLISHVTFTYYLQALCHQLPYKYSLLVC